MNEMSGEAFPVVPQTTAGENFVNGPASPLPDGVGVSVDAARTLPDAQDVTSEPAAADALPGGSVYLTAEIFDIKGKPLYDVPLSSAADILNRTRRIMAAGLVDECSQLEFPAHWAASAGQESEAAHSQLREPVTGEENASAGQKAEGTAGGQITNVEPTGKYKGVL